jgi:hypothetical protein
MVMQENRFSHSIRRSIALLTGLCLLITAVVLTAYSAFSQYRTRQQAAKEAVIAETKAQANSIDAQIEIALDTVRTASQMIAAVKTDTIVLSARGDCSNAKTGVCPYPYGNWYWDAMGTQCF